MIHQRRQPGPGRGPGHVAVVPELVEQQVAERIGARWRFQETDGDLGEVEVYGHGRVLFDTHFDIQV